MRVPRVRVVLAAIVAVIVLLFSSARPAEAAFDPALRFRTIETEHFRITYHTGLEEVAQHVANTSESIYGRMTEAMGYAPKREKTELLLVDNAESANGSATALPYNAIRLLVTAPEDFSPLGDVDDWYLELITHEFTHILHTDHIRGIPTLVNAVIGKTMAPNQVQPRWILEGYGVYFESAKTSGGRLRNSMWDMFMRTDVIEDNLATLDQMSNVVRRWPQGNLFYLYGSHFIQWIGQTYGEKALRQVSYDYGGQLIPWGIQRSIRRATGKTYDELYPLWIESMRREYGAQVAEVRRRGLREGVRLTHHGQIARYPRWIPDNAWAEHKGGLLYYRDDQHYRTGLFALDIARDGSGNVLRADEGHSDLVARTNVETYSSFLPDGGLVFSSADVYRNVFLFGELERMDPGEKSRYGTPDGKRVQLTVPAMRAADPSTSPDGRRVVFTQNKAGTRTLLIGDLMPNGISNVRQLVTTGFLEQSFTPRWSPDGMQVAYSVWKRGGNRDIRLVDVETGTWREITNDRAVDGSPSFSADGKWLYFHSDRTGIMNVYAYELATGRLKQVTNVLTGAYSPEPSPDGKTLAYVGYGKTGFDLYALRLDESNWLEAPEYVDDRPPAPTIPERRWESTPYSPWRTLLPRRYSVQVTPGSFGQQVIINAAGGDITGLHAVAATSIIDLEKPQIQGSIGYSYLGLPVDFSASAFRSVTPRAGYGIGQYRPTIVQENIGVATSLAYGQPKAFDSRSYVVSHSISRVGANLPMPIDKLDPYETPAIPSRGLASTLHFGYSFANAERYLWSVGPERGYALSLGLDVTDPILGSDFAGFATNGDFTTYIQMPWLKHHSLAFHAGGGTSGGSFPGRGAFFVGGFVDLPIVDTVRNQLIQGGITLRGYAPVAVAGRSYALGNAEYRFPIVNIDRGDSTMPFFLNRITGAVFVDYGTAF
ncbi:MAG: tolB protein precursor, partial [Labilithrix sp.]|nr:tolB protein precursor [Labilithrix sp.]